MKNHGKINQRKISGLSKDVYMEVNSDKTQKAYRRNFIILLLAGIGISIGVISGQMCGADVNSMQNNASDPTALKIQQALTRKFDSLFFAVELEVHDMMKDNYRIEVISQKQSEDIEPYLAAFVRTLETAALADSINVQFVLFYMDPETGKKVELDSIETSIAPRSSENVEDGAELSSEN